MLCKKCKEDKSENDFYVSNKSRCKLCVKAGVTANRKANTEYYKEYDRKRASLPHRVKAREDYIKTEKGRQISNDAKRRWEEKNRIKKAASTLVGNAVRDGKLVKTGCIVCSDDHRTCGHHEDYNYPLDVIWLCNLHHRQRHKEIDDGIELMDGFLKEFM